MRATIPLFLLIAAPAAAQSPDVAASMNASIASYAAAGRGADTPQPPTDPEVAIWQTREGRSHLRYTRAVHSGSSGLIRSFELGEAGQEDVPAAVVAWPDRREYDFGDTATVYVRNVGTIPGYVAVFRVDAQGQAHMLFPLTPADDNYVSRQQTIAVRTLPSGGTFAVDSVDGTSLLFAVISSDPLDFFAYDNGGRWSNGDALRVQAPPSDALTDHWGKLYWELSGLAQRMTEAYSAHLVTYAVAPRAIASSTPAMMSMQLAALGSSVPAAYYSGTFGIGSYLGFRGVSLTRAREDGGGFLDHCFAGEYPTFHGPWCAWPVNGYLSDPTCPWDPSDQSTIPACQVGAYAAQRTGSDTTKGGRPTNTPTGTPPRSTDIVGTRGATTPGAKGAPLEPPAYITSAFRPRASAPGPVGAPRIGGDPPGGASNHPGQPAAFGGGTHFAPPEPGGFTPPTAVGGGGMHTAAGTQRSGGGEPPTRADPPPRATPAETPALPPPPPPAPPPSVQKPPAV